MSADRIVAFGPGERLSGVLSGEPRPDGEVLVLLNAGTMPRVGPFRLYVDLARELAAQGRAVFRLDLPGVGEAPLLSDAGELEVLASALDALQARFGCRRFAVGGICSASDVAWRLSEKDRRVTGLLLLDPVAFRGPWFWLERWREFLSRSPARWWQVLRRRLRPAQAITQPAAGDFRDWPSREEAHAHVAALSARGGRMLVVFTGSARERFLDRRQLVHSFGPAATSGALELHFWPGSDHLFYLRCYRQALTEAVGRWLAPA
jgi:pimeloyl-ACP methyl ester carboxylesterase